ncbi:molybdopterin-binding protein [Chengkuizengella axinellae]|uniref:Molybdopterin molybdenumtransferase n=1 Tax=Chengkuizengella axinellae TaxID=3064388 RepID=A0ABT9J4T0_9BACL|nr:molybdopterin-binding protein [Chengkuizengella sp. 2205SS18-9]MDP5276641.1 molybdopterin-binding protein [Chengkuizengella sp. 2205SS18-9]
MTSDNMLQEIRTEDAVGMVLAHDLTQIIPGEFKGRLFKKGHVIQKDDIPKLLDIGKEHIYILNLKAGYLHENDAAIQMANLVQGENVELTEPHEGKVTIKSIIPGLAKVEPELIHQLNKIDEIAVATLKNNSVVEADQGIVGTRVIPLIVKKEKLELFEKTIEQFKQNHNSRSIIQVKPFLKLKVGLITTGGEVYTGRIKDKFGPIVKQKIADFGSEVVEQRFSPDDAGTIVQHIRDFKEEKVDLILITGGMSVDPDDRTPGAIKQAGADIVSYGTPMLPGSMLMMAYLDGTPIMGLPGCVMHDPYTSFDVLLPRICAGEKIEKEDITVLGYGGLHNC